MEEERGEKEEKREHAKRGEITSFSPRSRRRMMNSLAIINRDKAGLPSFLTPTYADELLPIEEKTVKRHLMALNKALERRFGKRPVMWRREHKARKSGTHTGKVMPHLHLLLWGVEPTDEDREWFAQTWCRLTGSTGQPWEGKHYAVTRHNRTWIMPESWRGTLAYVSKYLAKTEDGQVEGRTWGWWNRGLLPVNLLSEEIPQDAFHAVRRVLRRYIERHAKRKVRIRSKGSGLTCYLSEHTGKQLVAWAWNIGWSTESIN